ncbi:phage terminase small subunit P27 family, partial [Propionivibrio sp.]|uniref:phage terminase small subunit P27 family n=1 Tax=Propionivibrio sp. TaxID=2212460 RepID=UPI0025F00F8A
FIGAVMGVRGPKPQSNVIKLLRGNPGRRAIDLSDGVQPEVVVPDIPRHLTKEARKEWRRITVELEIVGLVSRLDRAALAIYCQTWGRLVLAEQALEAKRRQAEEAGEDQAEAVFTQKTPTGFMRESALIRIIGKLQQDCDRYLASFGMSPSSRSRVKPSDNRQSDLFEEATQDAWRSL